MRPSFIKVKNSLKKEIEANYNSKLDTSSLQSSEEEEEYVTLLEELSSKNDLWQTYQPVYEMESLMYGFYICFKQSSFLIEDLWSILYKQLDLIPFEDSKRYIIDIISLHFKGKYTLFQLREALELYMLVSEERRNFTVVFDNRVNTMKIEITNCARYRFLFFDLFFEPIFHQHQRQELPPVFQAEDGPITLKIRNKEMVINAIPAHLWDSIKERSPVVQNMLAMNNPDGQQTVSAVLDNCLEQMQFSRSENRRKVELSELSVDMKSDPYMEAANFLHLQRSKYGKTGRDYLVSRKSFQINAINGTEPSLFQYKPLLHIIGKTGSGKNTFIELELARVRTYGAKSGVVLTKVQDVFQQVNRLQSHGIFAAPIIGKTSILEHLGTEITSLHSKVSGDFLRQPLSELVKQQEYTYFSNDCILNTLAGIREEGHFPCTNLIITIDGKKQKRSCPFYPICGAGTRDRALLQADVWIGTIDSLFKSRPLPIFNDMNMSYAEIANRYLDLLFVDEGDSSQERMDILPVTHNDIFGQLDSTFEKEILTIKNELELSHRHANNTDVNLFIEHTRNATIMVKNIIGLLLDSSFLRHSLKNRSFTIFEMVSEMAEKLVVNGEDSERFQEAILEIAEEEADLREPIESFFRRFSSIKLQKFTAIDLRSKHMHQLVAELIDKMSNILKMPLKKDLSMNHTALFMFTVFLIQFDHLYMMLINLIGSLPLHDEHEIEKRFDFIKKYIPFMPEPLTERSFQYQYKVGESEEIGTFSLYEYRGVGRELLLQFSRVYRDIDGIEGPAVVLLSGTSVAPYSPHFHIEKEVDYIISSTVSENQKSKFTIEFAICNDENNTPISVSGLRDEEKKQALKKMAMGDLPSIIMKELVFWNQRRGSDIGRGVLLITNSYEQANVVHMELNRHMPNHAIYSLARNNSRLKENQIPLNLIEQFAGFGSRILLAPMKPISTGLNILQKGSSKSFFGTVIFLVRPLPPPGQLDDMIKVMSGSSYPYIRNLVKNQQVLGKGALALKRHSLLLMKKLLSVDKTFSRLEDEYRYPISWYVMKDVRQTIGRAQRGETDARILLADASWMPTSDKGAMTKSLLHDWLFMLENSQSKETKELYHDLYLALQDLLLAQKK
ncbi:hypothetical protein [Bacillus sp. FJAT-29814]|uniref:hypothetical protein n=1 Tax=Bacillus sp. FJAT-29814 TaxID=1729688 RepID=UPI00082F6F04|nr:hypothetical protein [Bacillus sp. FJAT-29814]